MQYVLLHRREYPLPPCPFREGWRDCPSSFLLNLLFNTDKGIKYIKEFYDYLDSKLSFKGTSLYRG